MSQLSPHSHSPRRFALRSYGCQMNDLDAEHIDGLLRADGWERTDDFEAADVILINTCAVRAHAEDRALGRLASFKTLKTKLAPSGTAPLLILCGCVAQKDGAALLKRYPHLDVVVGTRDWPLLTSLIDRARNGERIAAIDGIEAPLERPAAVHRASRVKARVEVMIGCDNYCSYCIVPFARGREVSRPAADIIADLERLARDGYKEVCLLGQNVNSYRGAPAGGAAAPIRFSDLLRLANRVEGLERIRFVTSNPHDLGDDLIEAMAALGKVCEHLHLPAQSGSDRILGRMNRRYTRAQYEALIARLRAAIPGIALTTDLLVGFPGETVEDFEQTVALQEAVRWDAAFTFMYSPREGTAAAALPDDVPRDEKQRRVAELIRRQEAISATLNAGLVGRRFEVLVETVARRHEGELMGRTRTDKPVIFPGPESLIGRLVTVEITQTSPHSLRAVISG